MRKRCITSRACSRVQGCARVCSCVLPVLLAEAHCTDSGCLGLRTQLQSSQGRPGNSLTLERTRLFADTPVHGQPRLGSRLPPARSDPRPPPSSGPRLCPGSLQYQHLRALPPVSLLKTCVIVTTLGCILSVVLNGNGRDNTCFSFLRLWLLHLVLFSPGWGWQRPPAFGGCILNLCQNCRWALSVLPRRPA